MAIDLISIHSSMPLWHLLVWRRSLLQPYIKYGKIKQLPPQVGLRYFFSVMSSCLSCSWFTCSYAKNKKETARMHPRMTLEMLIIIIIVIIIKTIIAIIIITLLLLNNSACTKRAGRLPLQISALECMCLRNIWGIIIMEYALSMFPP